MATDDEVHLRALLDKREELQTQAAIAASEYGSARRLQISAGRRGDEASKRRAHLARELDSIEQQIAVTRAALSRDGASDVSDRALVRWLELVEHRDLAEIRQRILAAIRSSPAVRDGDFFVHETAGVRVLVNGSGKVVSVTPAPPARRPK